MSETGKTIAIIGAAMILALVAVATTPRRPVPAALQDRGTQFFPAFTDPNAAQSLEVVAFDEATWTPLPFKVTNRNGKWTIPSKYDYPADAGDRLPKIAAAVMAMKKDDIASENVADHERCGVVDPADDTLAASTGRGTRVTVQAQGDKILADIIIGRPVEGRADFRYVRLPSQKRVYVSRVDALELSTQFEDWIERNLLQVSRDEIDGVLIRNYSMDQKTGDQTIRDSIVLQKKGADQWLVAGLAPGEVVDEVGVRTLIGALQRLLIVNIVPKPSGIAGAMNRGSGGNRVQQSDLLDLSSKGFYLTGAGQLLSNEGEAIVHTKSGIFYTLRFGQVAPGSAAARQQPAAPAAPASANRYMFISIGFDPGPEAPATPPPDVERLLAQQRARFAPWYYVISESSFQSIRVSRSSLVGPKNASGRSPS